MPTTRLAPLVGANVRRLRMRACAGQKELAEALTDLGLPWTLGHVSRLERGVSAAVDLPLLVLLAAALDTLPGQPQRVAVAELLEPLGESQGDDSPVALTEHLVVPSRAVSDALRGLPAGLLAQYRPAAAPERVPLRGRRGGYEAVDHRAARALGITDDEMIELSRRRWGRLLSRERAERIVRAADREGRSLRNPEKAAVTAQLVEELREFLATRRGEFSDGPLEM